MKNLQKLLLILLIAGLTVSVLSAAAVKAEEDTISDYDNVKAEQIINDINTTISSNAMEREIRYDQNHTTYRLTVSPQTATIGNSVNATAETDNPCVTHVTFIWIQINPYIIIKKIETVSVSGDNWKTAQSTYQPDKMGKWVVCALFANANSCKWLYAMLLSCFKVTGITQQIPDFPVVGTAGAMTTMLLGLGLFLNRKRQKPI